MPGNTQEVSAKSNNLCIKKKDSAASCRMLNNLSTICSVVAIYYTQVIEFVDKLAARIEKRGFFCYDGITFECE